MSTSENSDYRISLSNYKAPESIHSSNTNPRLRPRLHRTEAQNVDRYISKASGSFMSISTRQDKKSTHSKKHYGRFTRERNRFRKGEDTRGKKRRKEGGKGKKTKNTEENKQQRRTCSSSDRLAMENDDHFSERIIKTDFPRPHTLKDRALINYTPRID